MDDYYFYASGYRNGKSLNTTGLPALKNGAWRQGDFEGAVLKADSESQEDHVPFM